MNPHTIFTIMITFCIGISVGSLLVGFGVRRAEAKRLKLLMDSSNIQDRLYVAINSDNRKALQKLESGDTEAAKQIVSMAIASFYHNLGSCEFSQELAAERQKVDVHAKSSAILAAAIKKQSDERLKDEFLQSLSPSPTAVAAVHRSS